MKRRDWIAWLISDHPEAKEFVRLHPELAPLAQFNRAVRSPEIQKVPFPETSS
jgi:hypothetical protein